LNDFSLLGDHTIRFKLSANQGTSKEYTMKVTITNTAPYFIKTPETPIKMYIDEQLTIDMKDTYKDDEGH
jgi:hypothetical protein